MAFSQNQQNVTQSGPPDGSEVGELSGAVLQRVAIKVGGDWKKLGRIMNFLEPEIQTIQVNCIAGGAEEMAYQVLHKWTEKLGHEATGEKLKKLLESAERKDIADSLSSIVDEACSRVNIPTQINADGTTPKHSDELMANMKKRLKRQYCTFMMRGLPWIKTSALTLDKFYVDVNLTEVDDQGQDLPSEHVDIEGMFHSVEGVKPSRILVEGDPGLGKTTLAAKLAFDWAKDKSYIKHFDHVFLIPLRHFMGDITETLAKSASMKKEDEQYLIELLQDKSKCILLLLDGYDEISEDTQSKILPLLRTEVYPHTTVIVTSRPGKFTKNMPEMGVSGLPEDADVAPTFCNFIEKRIRINGFNSKQQSEFINGHIHYCSEQVQRNIRSKLDDMIDKEFLKCPLFLLMLIVVLTETPDMKDLTNNRTGLYKHVFNCIFKRYYSKLKEPFVSEMDLFSSQSIYAGKNKPLYIEHMLQFSKFSLYAIRSNKFFFTREEIVETCKCDPQILDLGFLTQHVAVKGMWEIHVYEPVHRSLLEFGAAYAVWMTYLDESSANGQWNKDIISIAPHMLVSELCLPFVVGLMRESADVVFNTLLPYTAFYSSLFDLILSCLREIEVTDSVLQSLIPFLPPVWQIKDHRFSLSEKHKSIVRFGLQKHILKLIEWWLPQKASIPMNAEIGTLFLVVTKTFSKADVSDYSHTKIKCKDLWCNLQMDGISKYHLECLVHLLKIIDFQRVTFHLPGNLLPDFHECHNKSFIGDRLHIIKICLDDLQFEYVEMINHLLNNKVEVLEISVDGLKKKPPTDRLFTYAALSPTLKSFTFVDRSERCPFKFDLAKLFKGYRESWKSVQLGGVKVYSSQKIRKTVFIDCLDLQETDTSKETTRMITGCRMTSLHCPASLLRHTKPSGVLNESVSEINLTVDATIEKGIANLLSKLKSLKVLALTLVANFKLSLPVGTWLLGSQHSLCLNGIEIWYIFNNPAVAVDLLKGISQCLSEPCDPQPVECISSPLPVSESKKLQLKYVLVNHMFSRFVPTACINFTEVQRFFSIAANLKLPLRRSDLPRLDIVPTFAAEIQNVLFAQQQFLLNVFRSEDGFSINYDTWGCKPDDSVYSSNTNDLFPESTRRYSIRFKDM